VNRPIRRVGAAIGVLMLALLINLNFVQVYKADSYRNNPGNRRILLDEYGRQRGSIVVQGAAVASSVKTKDRLKYLRKYADGPVYAPLTGYDSLFYGTTGMEQAASSLLSGDDNRLFTTRLSDLLTGRDPRGGDVVLTINRKAQEAAYKAMGKHAGAVVAIDPRTGAILAAVSTPSYDPNLLSSHSPTAIHAAYTKLNAEPSQPLLNRAFDQLYPPGSVFKVVVAAAALQHGRKPTTVLAAPTRLRLPGTTTYLNNYGGESCSRNAKITLDNALTISCNTAFAKLAIGLGTPTIRAQAAAFGINDQGYSVPLNVAASTIGPVIDQAALAQSAIGQRDVRVTPLQAAAMVAAVANKGVLMTPYLVDQELAPNLSVLQTTSAHVQSRPIDAAHDAQLVTMMEHVVSRGTGTPARIPGIVVAGKTGTADTGLKTPAGKAQAPDAWFAGFAPAATPKIAVAVIVENAGVSGNETTGGKVAAPIAASVMQAYLNSLPK
jgi:peptidoglycan glycosyltransferase